MITAVIATLGSALFFALAATLQQQEAGMTHSASVVDPRLLWRLAHRPLWLVGIAADGLAVVLQIVALSFGPVSLVQPLGVTGLLFAIPMVALRRRTAIRHRDLAAAFLVLLALVILLRLLVVGDPGRPGSGAGEILIACGSLGLAGVAGWLAQKRPGRARALLLAGAAGLLFGTTAVLLRAMLQLVAQRHYAPAGWFAIGIVIMTLVGYLLLQNGYRTGHFAATLATTVVVDAVAAFLGGILVLNEPLQTAPPQVIGGAVCAVLIVAGIAWLASSPAHVFEVHQVGSVEPGEVPS